MATAIQIESLSKRYRLGLTHAGSIRELANQFVGRLVGKRSAAPDESSGDTTASGDNSFWALKDINFSVFEGDTLAVIGRNGAGKSTLLKILSRITSPTTGHVELFGRVASLLEVGTGFHPELTGRENLYLNGTILGMTRSEVRRQLDPIVDFAGVEKFIDTPVKRYSSGMKVRLGFAIAAHLEPEILIVDEVLAVGDLDFQKKCLGKMDDVSKSGRTIIFVSHNMAAVSQLCRTGIVLNAGTADGVVPISEAIDLYMRQSSEMDRDGCFVAGEVDQDGHIAKIQLRQDERDVTTVRHDQAFDLQFSVGTAPQLQNLRLSIAVCDRFQQKIFTAVTPVEPASGPQGDHTIQKTLRVRGRFLMPGRYSIIAGLLDSQSQILDHHRFVCPFQIENVGDDPLLSGGGNYGLVFGEHQWLEAS